MLSVRLYPFLLDIIFIHLRSSDIMARIDPYNHQRGYSAWKKASENGIKSHDKMACSPFESKQSLDSQDILFNKKKNK